jgi:replicative DNA helicase
MPPPPQRLPPANEQAEQAVLASVLLDRSVVGQLAGQLTARDFYQERHGFIWQAMLDLDGRGEPVDYLTLVEALEKGDRLKQAGGAGYIAGLIGAVPTPLHAEQYASLVTQAATMRRLISCGVQISTMGWLNELETEAALARAEALLSEVAADAPGEPFIAQEDGIRAYYEHLVEMTTVKRGALDTTYRIPSTYRDLDTMLGGGFSKGDLVLLGGRPGMGKSALMVEILRRSTVRYRYGAVLFSLEMSALQVYERMMATGSGIPITTLRSGRLTREQEVDFGITIGRLAELDILTSEVSVLSLPTLRSRVRRVASRTDISMVVVDHIQLLSAAGENRVAEMGVISRGLKALAREHNVVVLALAQLSRASEQRADKVPLLSDLRESGSLEQDADVVLLLHREEYYKPDTERAGLADLRIEKNRNGQTGAVTLLWKRELTGFGGLEDVDQR